MPSLSLRAKFLFALVAISAAITSAMLLIVRYRVEIRVRDEIGASLDASITTFARVQQQRELTLERSAALLAALPTLKAVMTSGHAATIQDASASFWQLAGSQLLVLADRHGTISAFHASTPAFPRDAAQAALQRDIADGQAQGWWYGGGRLFEVFLQPIYVGVPGGEFPIGVLAVGYEVNDRLADDIARVASSDVAFAYDGHGVVSTIDGAHQDALWRLLPSFTPDTGMRDLRLHDDSFVARTVSLAERPRAAVTLTVLRSLGESTAFLAALNAWVVGIGAAGILVGAVLVFLVSTSFTRPLKRLVSGVQALEGGDYDYPLDTRGGDEVAALTTAFDRMRRQIQVSQRQLVESERLATIGRMANTISHDLRRPLTAIQAYAELLAERPLTDAQRRDYFQEIRIAINHMLDEINGLLGFAHENRTLRRVPTRLDELIDRAIKTVKALPEFEGVAIRTDVAPDTVVFADPGKVERVLLNLLFNAAEAVSPDTGAIDVIVAATPATLDIRVRDNGPGIPSPIADSLFEPFVSHGKQKGTGLGLTVVQTVMQQHGGDASVEQTGAGGTTFLLRLPVAPLRASAPV